MKEGYIPKVSVIIPVWNPGPGISRCIESLRNQTLRDIEMLFIDDRGNDDSMEKVRTAASEDPRIRIIENEENIGAGPSRNKGIEVARGEYLSFVDPDDYLAPDFLRLLYEEASKESLDIVKGSIIRVKEDGTILPDDRHQNQVILEKYKAGKPLFLLFTYAHQSAIYRRLFLITKNAFYGASARSQDDTFLLKACSHAESFALVDAANYFFCERLDSAMHTMDEMKLQGSLQARRDQIQYITTNLENDDNTFLFIKNVFLGGMREYIRYDNVQGMEENANHYLRELREELMDHPFYDILTKDSFPLRALCDYGVGLPMIPYYSPWEGNNPPIRYAQLVKRWVDFFIATPKESDSCWKEMRMIIVKADNAVNGIPRSTYSKYEQKEGKALLIKQIKLLPFYLKFELEAFKTKERARLIAATFLPKTIKKKIRLLLGNSRQRKVSRKL